MLFSNRFSRDLAWAFALASLGCATTLRADTFTIEGAINQSTQDGTGPAFNNPSLNNIQDGSLYVLTLSFLGSITAPGTYNLTAPDVSFRVASDGAAESSFDSVSVTVAQSAGFDEIGILACLTSGSACNQGNELDLNFSILAGDLNRQNAAAQQTPNLLPLDLLEDDGVTDIHGTVTGYSYTPPVGAVPEPCSVTLLGTCLIAAGWMARSKKRTQK